MPGRRKKFIEKKSAVSYRLVPRCELDPDCDGDASECVLVPVNETGHEEDKRKKLIKKEKGVTYRLAPRCHLDPDGDASEHVLVPLNETVHKKYNIKLPELALPPSAEQIPSLKKQVPVKGPQPDWDPDIVAALDDDFDYEDSENVLEDDFVARANTLAGEYNLPDASKTGSESCDSDDGFLFSGDDDDDPVYGHQSHEKKSRFTNYSLTSAVTNCTEEIKTFNERFEKLCEAYEDDQIGALDFEDIEGYLTPESQIVKDLMEDFEKNKKKLYLEDNHLDENMKEKILYLAEMSGNEKLVKIVIELPQEYDCESIISTYSNKFNHPAVIKADRKEKPVKISTNPRRQKLTKSNLKQLDREANAKDKEGSDDDVSENNLTIVSSCCFRPKNETPEERRLRKQNVKQTRKENRIVKKENKLAFKEEKKRQTSAAINTNRNRGIHLP